MTTTARITQIMRAPNPNRNRPRREILPRPGLLGSLQFVLKRLINTVWSHNTKNACRQIRDPFFFSSLRRRLSRLTPKFERESNSISREWGNCSASRGVTLPTVQIANLTVLITRHGILDHFQLPDMLSKQDTNCAVGLGSK